MHRKSLHLALAALFAAPLAAPYLEAQIHKVAAPETVTRAIGVYEFTGTLEKPSAVRMIPVTIFINNRLEDAGTYLTRPMPLALQTGVIYSIEQAGKSIGTVTLDYARHALPLGVNPELAETGSWNGFGNFALPAKPKPSTLAAAKKIGPITGGNDNPDDDRPHFTGKQPGDGNTAPAATTTASTTAAPANPAPADDPDRPHLNKHEPSATPASTTPDPDINDDTDRPTLKHRDLPPEDSDGKPKKQKKQGDSAVIPMSSSLNEDPDRPTLKRGKSTGVATPQELQGIPVDLHQIVAISNASNRDAHIFARQWETHTEHADVQAKLAALAQPLITKYEADNKIEAPTLTELPVNTRQSSTHATTRAKGKSAAANLPPRRLIHSTKNPSRASNSPTVVCPPSSTRPPRLSTLVAPSTSRSSRSACRPANTKLRSPRSPTLPTSTAHRGSASSMP